LLVYEWPWTTHFTGYCCELCEVSGNTLYWASLLLSDVGRLHQWVQNNHGKVKLQFSTLGTSDINYYSVSTAGTVGGKYPLLSIDGADGN
jgi:hypothetical protein